MNNNQTSAYKQINSNPTNKSTSKQLYSFPKSPRFTYKKDIQSTDTFYDIKNGIGDTKHGVSFGSGIKTDFSKLATQTPGPQYNLTNSFTNITKSKQHTMGSGRIFGQIKEEAPGPGAYEITSSLMNKTITFGQKFNRNDQTCSPGPGKYKVDIKEHSYQATFKSPERVNIKQIDQTPGPQTYRTDISPGRYHATIFSKQQRFILRSDNLPGPGTYKIPGEFGIY